MFIRNLVSGFCFVFLSCTAVYAETADGPSNDPSQTSATDGAVKGKMKARISNRMKAKMTARKIKVQEKMSAPARTDAAPASDNVTSK